MSDDLISHPPDPVYILGTGMHPWGKWGRDFTEYGVVAARAALADAGLDWRQIQLVAGAETIRNGYPGFVAGPPSPRSWAGPASRCRLVMRRVRRDRRRCSRRAQILAGLCDVALVVGADTTPKGFFAPVGGERRNDPDWQRFHLIGATNTVYFALLARRRMDLFGATPADFAQVKVKNSPARPAQPECPLPQREFGRGRAGQPGGVRPASATGHLRHLRRCRRPDSGEQGLHRETPGFDSRGAVGAGGVLRHPGLSPTSARTSRHRHRLDRGGTCPERVFKDHILDVAYAEAGIGPRT